jgi:hypothetical protein|tara:strand:+ start:472 stop:1119 length:648 start_codon:yes stop_codon:yes gene_type:complete
MATAQQVDFTLVNLFGNASASTAYDGALLGGGKIYWYDPGTTDTKTVWQDSAKVSAHNQPVVLDAYGYSEIYADGLYDIKITDADDNTINTADNLFYNTGTSGILSTRDVTTAYTTTTTGELILADTTSSDFTITLQTAVGVTGEHFTIANVGTGVLTIDGDGSETIGGATSVKVHQNGIVRVWSDNTNWIENIPREAEGSPRLEARCHSYGLIF